MSVNDGKAVVDSVGWDTTSGILHRVQSVLTGTFFRYTRRIDQG